MCGALVAALAGIASAGYAGFRVNTSPSMPVGIWRVAPASEPLERGDIVTVCLPDDDTTREAVSRGYISAGPCPGGYEPLIKPVAAVADDAVVVSRDGVSVNREPIPGTKQLAHDTAGRPLQPADQGWYRVKDDEVWVLSGHDPRSFDSRYFGPIPVSNVRGIARPVWVFE
ncbi:MAG: conjugative transfer signal peptidase TraF [Acetobacteraceae bacterium]|nr:conjugative transfer signal peptidase TraF [Acetobacteraceae bacterium]